MSQGVHIVTTGFVPRDAISHHVIEEQRIIRDMGLRCEIFANPELTDPALSSTARSIHDWTRHTHADDAAILHYSIANPAFEPILKRARCCGLTYHNITPASFLWDFAPRLALECLRGRRHLAELAGRVAATAADSEFNAEELRALGFPDPTVVGLLRAPLPPVVRLRTTSAGRSQLLFVGRGVPNKAQHDLILSLAALTETGFDATLRLIGAWGGLESYRRWCGELATRTGVDDRVEFAGSVDDRELAQAYADADLFVCLSDHEGFCAPLLEAMIAGLPIVAYASTAIPGTVGDAALLLDEKPPSLVAEAVIETFSNPVLRQSLEKARSERLIHHGAQAVTARFCRYVEQLL